MGFSVVCNARKERECVYLLIDLWDHREGKVIRRLGMI